MPIHTSKEKVPNIANSFECGSDLFVAKDTSDTCSEKVKLTTSLGYLLDVSPLTDMSASPLNNIPIIPDQLPSDYLFPYCSLSEMTISNGTPKPCERARMTGAS